MNRGFECSSCLGRRLAIMQPYLFPYVGYFQLVAAVDRFIFYDDVNFMKGGWVNRNRLLLSGGVQWFTFPLSGASSHSKINEIQVQQGDVWRRKLLSSVRQSYGKAKYFAQAYALLEDVVMSGEASMSSLAQRSIVSVASYLGIETKFVSSTGRYRNEGLHGTERVLDICKKEAATEYHNLPGGERLYLEEQFASAGISLFFVRPNLASYIQFSSPFVPALSMLDVLMFNDRAATLRLLDGTYTQ